MRQEEINNIKKEIEQAVNISNIGSTKKKEPENFYDKIVQSFADKFLTAKIGKSVSFNFVKKISKSIHNFMLGMQSWAIKNKISQSHDIKCNIEDIMDQFIDSADDLKKRYKLLKNIANNYPEHNKYVLTTVEQLSKKEQNNINNLGQIFELCNKIGNDSPELHPNVLETKRKVLANFCVNNPQQGLLFISSLTLDAYPSKEDLNVAYSGIIAILNSSKTNKNLYIPLVKILTECAKSGLNDSENKEKLEFICRNIDAKDKKLEAENILSNNRDISDIILASKKKVRANISKVSANHQLKEEKNTNKSNTQYRKKQKTPKKTVYQY